MGFLDELNNAMKKVEEEVKKADLDKHFRDLEEGINKAGSTGTKDAGPNTTPASQKTAPASAPVRSHHPEYSRLTAWVKSRYQARIAGCKDPLQKKLELEQVSAEACSGLSSKAKKGFLEYLKSQNYEQLLR
jgi:hypothetical protein